ncbi:lipoyl(octanoyl) transferase [Fistulifera solaris]|uniref:lipoyl(octanoyl) transferase n=1 Tax=Fistulifera solaris TaxID=1519565 RepID=A0A1Z5J719_FISSO|nr:lipoyl(octanoyl) transferase [Fistulifera solaris]|eukprot:GAX09794.1 lipoyl(octanoyl) transferase [Fistulifera solaris]
MKPRWLSTTTTTSSTTTIIRRKPVVAHNFLSRGCIPYSKGWAFQAQQLQQRRATEDSLLLFEHGPVYTLGRGANEQHLTFYHQLSDEERERLSRTSRGPGSARLDRWCSDSDSDSDATPPVLSPTRKVPIYRVERGGQVTFHGPGQLVIYPIFDLQRAPFRKDLHWLVRQLEESILRALQTNYDIEGRRDEINSGVWVGHDKIAAIGVSASRWITYHGLALNVAPDLSYFDTSQILPCGLDGRGVTSIAKVWEERGERKPPPSVQDVALSIQKSMEVVFGIEIRDYEITNDDR